MEKEVSLWNKKVYEFVMKRSLTPTSDLANTISYKSFGLFHKKYYLWVYWWFLFLSEKVAEFLGALLFFSKDTSQSLRNFILSCQRRMQHHNTEGFTRRMI